MKGTGRVEILIDELVLTGFEQKDRFAIGAALESELGRLVSEQGLPSGLLSEATPMRRPVSFRADDARPAEIGVQIARSLYDGLETNNNRDGMKNGK